MRVPLGMKYGHVDIVVCRDSRECGRRAAADVAAAMRRLLARKAEIRMVFAAGESQTTFLDSLALETQIDWSRVECFNMDDFWDTAMSPLYSCGWQTQRQLYDKVHPRAFHLVGCNALDPYAEAARFETELRRALPIDILCQGIGTSGHLALNEPGATHFDETALVKVVNLIEQSKKQLRADPNFRDLGYIPAKGITMTVPALMAALNIFTIVPLALKRPIMTRVLDTPRPTEEIPATAISARPGKLYLDHDSCPPRARRSPKR